MKSKKSKPKKSKATKRKRTYHIHKDIQTTLYLNLNGLRYCVTEHQEFEEPNRFILTLKAIAYKELGF